MKTPTEKTVMVLLWASNVKRMNNYEIEDRCGIPHGSIGKWITGERKSLSGENIGKILLGFPEISAEWMFRGQEEQICFNTTSHESVLGDSSGHVDSAATIRRLIDERDELKRKLEIAQKAINAMLG